MARTQLEYLKDQFLKNSKFNYFHNTDSSFGQKEIQSFLNGLSETTNKVKNVETEEELLGHINNFRKIYLDSFKPLRDMNHPIKEVLGPYFFNAKINLVDKWHQEEKQLYEDKIKHGFFEKFRSFFITNPSELDNLLDNAEIKEKVHGIISKYKLTGIHLNELKTVSDAKEYLEKMDTNFDDVCARLGVKHEAIGLNGSLGFSHGSGASYSHDTRNISTSIFMSSKSTLLHEWIHALDNYIAMDITNEKDAYVSDFKGIAPIDKNDSMNQAFHTMKRLTSRIFNSNSQVVEKNIADQMHLGSCKFLSLAMGSQWYGLDTEDRKTLLSPDIKDAINNYISRRDIKNDALYHDLVEKISATGIIDADTLHDNLHAQNDAIWKEVTPYYEKMNKLIQSSPSAYYIGSKMSSWSIYLGRGVDAVTNQIYKLIGKKPIVAGNGNDSDYFVQPVEMVARYFESQVYPKDSQLTNLAALGAIYKVTKDKDFDEIKNRLISQALGADIFVAKQQLAHEEKKENQSTLSRILGIRRQMKTEPVIQEVRTKNTI